jgi:hypothetical protein
MNQAIYHTLQAYQDKVNEINLFLGYPNDRGTDTYATLTPEPVNVGTEEDEQLVYLLSITEQILHLFHNHTEFTEGYAKLVAKKAQDKPVRVLIPLTVFKNWLESDNPEIIGLVQYCNTNGITEATFDENFSEGYDIENVLPKQVYLEFIYPIHAELVQKYGAIIEE